MILIIYTASANASHGHGEIFGLREKHPTNLHDPIAVPLQHSINPHSQRRYHVPHHRQRRVVAFRPLFVYRQEQIEKRRIDVEAQRRNDHQHQKHSSHQPISNHQHQNHHENSHNCH